MSDNKFFDAPASVAKRMHGRHPPSDILSIVLMQTCLRDFPWLRLGDGLPDRRRFERWAKQLTPAELLALQQQESSEFKPKGPRGMWARAECVFLRWERPHRLDEVFVEAMYPCWGAGPASKFQYVSVISSGPIGCYAVYLGIQFQYLIANPPQPWWDDFANRTLVFGQAALARYNGGTGPNSLGNASCIFSMANLRGSGGAARVKKPSST